LPLGLSLAAACLDLRAQTDDATAVQKTRVQKQVTRLILADAGHVTTASQLEAAEPPAAGAEETLALEPMIVTGSKVPQLPPALHETPVTEFLRTGTLWERIGHKIKTKLWMRGDKGVMLSFSW
jgi:hypothetical protein